MAARRGGLRAALAALACPLAVAMLLASGTLHTCFDEGAGAAACESYFLVTLTLQTGEASETRSCNLGSL